MQQPIGFRLQSGVQVCPCLPFKSGSTFFRGLLLWLATNRTFTNPHFFRTSLHRSGVQVQEGCAPAAFRFTIVRNPYDRLISFYHNKVKTGEMVPENLTKHSTFKTFARRVAALPPQPPLSLIADHVESITRRYACARNTTVYRLENIAHWLPHFLQRLGRGRPLNMTLSDHLPVKPLAHNKSKALLRRCSHFDAETAAAVTHFVAADLISFGYARFDPATDCA